MQLKDFPTAAVAYKELTVAKDQMLKAYKVMETSSAKPETSSLAEYTAALKKVLNFCCLIIMAFCDT